MIHIQKPDGTVLTWAEKDRILVGRKVREFLNKSVLGLPSKLREPKKNYYWDYAGYVAPNVTSFIPERVPVERKPDTGISINNYDPTLKVSVDKEFLINILSDFAQFYRSGMNSGSWSGRPVINSVEIADEWIDQNLSCILNFK